MTLIIIIIILTTIINNIMDLIIEKKFISYYNSNFKVKKYEYVIKLFKKDNYYILSMIRDEEGYEPYTEQHYIKNIIDYNFSVCSDTIENLNLTEEEQIDYFDTKMFTQDDNGNYFLHINYRNMDNKKRTIKFLSYGLNSDICVFFEYIINNIIIRTDKSILLCHEIYRSNYDNGNFEHNYDMKLSKLDNHYALNIKKVSEGYTPYVKTYYFNDILNSCFQSNDIGNDRYNIIIVCSLNNLSYDIKFSGISENMKNYFEKLSC
jgi:hypothetical protein